MDTRIIFICGLATFVSGTLKLHEVYSWKTLDWKYPSSNAKEKALQSGALIPENAIPIGALRWKNKLFITVPRIRTAGVPATLNYISLDAPYERSPKLIPYPSYKANELGNCQTGLNTVYRSAVDKCDRLWVVDLGTYGYDTNVTRVCPITLYVFDLNTDQRIRRYVFRPKDIESNSLLTNIAIDDGATCEDTFAYFTDEFGYAIIVYSWQQNKSWKFKHGYFMPDPLAGDFNIGGIDFQWYDSGSFGITASTIGSDGYRTVYFTSLASYTEFAVSARVLRNESLVNNSYHEFYVVGYRGPNSHTSAKVFADIGVKLFCLVDQNAIGCWNSAISYTPRNIAVVDKDDNKLIYPSDIKVDDANNVWVLSNKLPLFLESTLDYSEINFRVYTASIKDLIKGTQCEISTVSKYI